MQIHPLDAASAFGGRPGDAPTGAPVFHHSGVDPRAGTRAPSGALLATSSPVAFHEL